MRKILIFILFDFIVLNQVLYSQLREDKFLSLHSLEDKEVSLKIKFDYRYDRISLELDSDKKICIEGFRYLSQEIKILNNKFVELQIGMRGGSGESVHRYVLICTSKNRLYKSIDLISLVENLIDSSTNYKEDVIGIIEKNNSYEMTMIGESTLHFDFNNKVFFNGYKKLKGSYFINSERDLSSEKINFNNEKFPSLSTQCGVYIFIRNQWYVQGEENQLMELSSGCD